MELIMNLAQKYVYTVYEKKSFSAAAADLFISQPSLSAMVKKLEKELGFSIFDRTKNPIHLTPEGEIYINYLEASIDNELLMKERLRNLSAIPQEELRVGGGSFTSLALFPIVCKKMKEENPNLIIKFDLGSHGPRHNTKDKVHQGLLDISFAYTFDRTRFDFIPIVDEKHYLTLSKTLPMADRLAPYAIDVEDIISQKKIDINYDYEIPYDIPTLRKDVIPGVDHQQLTDDLERASCTITNSRSAEIFYDLMLSGIGADITSEILIAKKRNKSKNILILPISGRANKRTAYLIYRKGAILSRAAKMFIEITQELCRDKRKLFEII
jgi:DNA-binding transcriptional LysR family regulator